MNDHGNYQAYIDEYNNFIRRSYDKSNRPGAKYLKTANIQIDFSTNCRLLQYNTRAANLKKIFLIVPSIFNSPEILFLYRKNNLINNLRKIGDVYLLEWVQIQSSEHSLDNYVLEVIKVIIFLVQTTNRQIELIGHCIGGNLALAAGIVHQELISSLSLLTTPWDFAHLAPAYHTHQYLDLDHGVRTLSHIPKIYLQILFFLLFPQIFSTKIDKYFKLVDNKEKKLFLEVENWLMSGYPLPKATYEQIMLDMLKNNIQVIKQWQIGKYIIDPVLFIKPVCQVLAKDDNLVPQSSILPLYNSFTNSYLLELEGGHINYLISKSINNFLQKYNHWIGGLK